MTIVIYTKAICPYCVRAKALLTKKGATFQEIDITDKPALRTEMIEKAKGRTTVPQIFIKGKHIGGCDDLHALEDQGKLDALLRS
ncbi:MAG: glutaredoxin 3 [Alphaproteobacteria bacterium]